MPETMSREAFAEHIKGLRKVLSKFPVIPKQIWENEAGRQVTMWCTGEASFHDEVRDSGLSEEGWTYQGEYIFIFDMDESGEKTESVVEFLDSKETERLRGLMRRARENLGEPETSP